MAQFQDMLAFTIMNIIISDYKTFSKRLLLLEWNSDGFMHGSCGTYV